MLWLMAKRPKLAVETSKPLASRRFNIENVQQLDSESVAQLIIYTVMRRRFVVSMGK